jgi:glycosyltransferase involved in cell wall biosynthesis
MLEQLPDAPSDKTGWPWTEESEVLSVKQKNGNDWPRISIVTPGLNHGRFLEETIRSVLLQNYPNLEYIIIDGGSNDDSVEIIKKYEQWITYWVTEKDYGQSNAINKGFKIATGTFINWLCSDDLLYKNALYTLAPLLANNFKGLIIGKGIRVDRQSKMIDEINASSINNFKTLLNIKHYWRRSDSIMQQSCFYPLSEIRRLNYLNERNHLTMDFELWGKLFYDDIPVLRCDFNIGIFRWYEGQKTSDFNAVTRSLIITALSLIKKHRKLSFSAKATLSLGVIAYYLAYRYHDLRSRLGVKRRLKRLFHAGYYSLYK